MVRLLHTADVHLRADAGERMEALRELLALAAAKEVDAVTVEGDLFDRPEDVEELRTELRTELFADRPFDVLVIPGNHDVEAFRGDIFFGDACQVFPPGQIGTWEAPTGDLRITGLPYRERPVEDVLLQLENREPYDGAEALLFHGSLQGSVGQFETGEETEGRYFPVTEELLVDLGFDVFLAGHYHSQHELKLANGSVFTYPGTPASTTVAETGRRQASLFDLEGGLSFVPLETFHFERTRYYVSPGEEASLLETVETWAREHCTERADAEVTVEGHVEMDEAQFHERLSSAAAPAAVVDRTRNVSSVLAHPLFGEFEARLETRDWDDETTEAVRDQLLAVFSQLDARGEL